MRVLTEKQLKWAYTKWCEGYSVLEIAEALYIDSSTLYRIFRQRGMIRIRIPLEYKEE